MVEKPSHAANPLEQYVLLAKSTKGAACVELIKQAIEAPGVYVFGELLDMPNIQELASTTCFNTLNLFAYGTYKEYVANPNNYLELSIGQKKKLQHLTIVTLATRSKCIPYTTLLEELEIKNVRELEDLIIEAIYADIILGKLDQKCRQLEVDYAIGRDIKVADIGIVVDCLQKWCTTCENVLASVDTQINRANIEKNRSVDHKTNIEKEVCNVRRLLKVQVHDRSEGLDEVMTTDTREATASVDKGKKSSKSKSTRSGPVKKYGRNTGS